MSLVTWRGKAQPKLVELYNSHKYINPLACDNPLDAAIYDSTVIVKSE